MEMKKMEMKKNGNEKKCMEIKKYMDMKGK